MPIFGGVKCSVCNKTGKKEQFLYDATTGQYFCCEEHRKKASQLKALMESAEEKGLMLCSNCLKEIKPTAYVCKYCGNIFHQIKGYEVGKMCPFSVVSIGGTKIGMEEYVWQHMQCIQEYCALWDTKSDTCSIRTR
jgi:hypothetical protein